MRKKRKQRRELLITVALALALLAVGGLAQRLGGSRAAAPAPTPRVCRVMTGNRAACYPVNGQYYDWIELENPGDVALSLRGWHLADGPDLRGAYVFGDVELPAGGKLLAYCAPRPDDAPDDAIFTGFSLDSDGEPVVLADPGERIVQTLAVPAMKADHVYRLDDSGEWVDEPVAPESAAVAADLANMNGVRLNEVMPVNRTTLTDADGDTPDWIELYNGGGTAVDLEGCALSDVDGKSDRWRFPAVTLEPGEYLVVFCSGKNRRAPGSELHTNFKLSDRDGAVHLFDPDGQELSRLSCDSAEADVSLSRTDDGGVTRLFTPTPGYRNSAAGVPEQMPVLTENATGLYINELMNVGGGDDWAELYNASPAEIDLTGMGLSDNPSRPRKWQFPSGATIPAGGCLLVSLAGEGAKTSAPYNAGFRLSTGETLCLSQADGTIIDRVRLYAQPPGVSFGRAQGEPRYRYFAEPTPGAANAAASYANQAQKVTFSEPGGLHAESSLSVALSSDSGATIHYTTDGTEPTTSSSVYREPLNLTGNTTVRAIATLDGALPSAQSAATYILGEAPTGVYMVCVSGDYEALIGANGCMNTGFKKDDCDVFVEIYGADGAQLIGQACNFMVSGHSSRTKYPQKAFRLKARSEYGDSRFRAKLFSKRDYTVFKSITLRASGQDNEETHMKDSVLAALAGDTGVMYMESEVAVVYIDGQYWGLYNLRERVTPVAVAQFEGWSDPDDLILLRRDTSEQGSPASYKKMMAWLATADLSNPGDLDLLRQYVDVENYMEYVALEMYLSNLDLSNVRSYCNPAIGAKWKWILFDLDMSYRVDRNTPRDWLTPGGVGTITQQDNTMFVKLMANAEMRDWFLRRMGELLRTTFSAENVVARIQERHDLIAPLMEANCQRWGWNISKWQKSGAKFVEFARTRPKKLVEYLTLAFGLTDAQAQTYFAGVE